MGTFDRLAVGDRVSAPESLIPLDARDVARDVGGYTHPLFTDDDWVREHSPFAAGPVPGEFVLFLLGGLAERSGAFDHTTIALVGLDQVRFEAPAFPGDTIRLEMEVVAKEPSSSGRRGSMRLRWTCTKGDGTGVLSAIATFLFDLTSG